MANESDEGLETLEQLDAQLRRMGLPFPPVPGPLVSSVRRYGSWLFASREPPADWTALGTVVDEAVSGEAPDHMLLAHAGHGVNSWAIHYQLVFGSLACFLQIPWGGVYGDRAAETDDVARAFAKVALLLQSLDGPVGGGQPSRGERLVVAARMFDSTRWCRVIPGPTASPDWQLAPQALDATLAELAAAA